MERKIENVEDVLWRLEKQVDKLRDTLSKAFSIAWLTGWMFTMGLLAALPDLTPGDAPEVSLFVKVLVYMLTFIGWPAFLGAVVALIIAAALGG